MMLMINLWFLVTLALGQAPQRAIDLNQQAVVTTSEGTFVLSFYPGKAPKHVELFLKLASEGAYDGTRFHRVVKWGIIQGGDLLSRDPSTKNRWGSGGANKVRAELSDIKHVRGTRSEERRVGKECRAWRTADQ